MRELTVHETSMKQTADDIRAKRFRLTELESEQKALKADIKHLQERLERIASEALEDKLPYDGGKEQGSKGLANALPALPSDGKSAESDSGPVADTGKTDLLSSISYKDCSPKKFAKGWLEKLEGIEVKTIADLERVMSEGKFVPGVISGVGQTAIDKMTNLLMAYRKENPIPVPVEVDDEPAPEIPPEDDASPKQYNDGFAFGGESESAAPSAGQPAAAPDLLCDSDLPKGVVEKLAGVGVSTKRDLAFYLQDPTKEIPSGIGPKKVAQLRKFAGISGQSVPEEKTDAKPAVDVGAGSAEVDGFGNPPPTNPPEPATTGPAEVTADNASFLCRAALDEVSNLADGNPLKGVMFGVLSRACERFDAGDPPTSQTIAMISEALRRLEIEKQSAKK